MVVWGVGLTRVGGGQKFAYGTFDGVYFHDLREPNREPVNVLALTDVALVDILGDYGLYVRRRNKPTFRKLLQGGNDTLRIYKEFYIPVQSSSIHFLRTKLWLACVNGFEIIDPDTLDTQGLLDPSDGLLHFVRRRSNNTRPKPVAIYRIENKFLLCYDGVCRIFFSLHKVQRN
jgi:hypothetical protein